MEAAYLDWLAEIDTSIVEASKDIKVLSKLTWDSTVQKTFLDGVADSKLALPRPSFPTIDLSHNRDKLSECIKQLDGDEEPLRRYLHATASSYHTLCLLLESIGTGSLTAHSINLYGSPTDSISSGNVNNLEAAKHFLEVSQSYRQDNGLNEADYCLSAELLAGEMRKRLDDVFEPGLVRVEIDSNMASKAAAGATRVRLRGGTCFSEYDLEQLLQHEAFVHSLTAINGNRQTRFHSLGLGSPRTTGAQEGLATFSELVTGVMISIAWND